MKLEKQPTTIGKRIFLIASDYVHADTQELKDAVVKGKANMTSGTGTSADYVKYWDRAPEYNCTLPSDSGKACTFPKLFEFSQYDIEANASNNNSKCASSLLCTENWLSFANDWADYATGGPSVEMWMNSWNKRHDDKKRYCSKSDSCGTYGYYVGSTENPDAFRTSVGDSDPLYFPHTTSTFSVDNDDENEYCDGYWLASPFVYDYGSFLGEVRYEGEVYSKKYNSDYCGVRPIVCLKSDVKLVKSSETLEGKDNAECFELVK